MDSHPDTLGLNVLQELRDVEDWNAVNAQGAQETALKCGLLGQEGKTPTQEELAQILGISSIPI